MRLVIEVRSGPKAGTKIELEPGQQVEIGRILETATTLGADPYMSGRHFAVVCQRDGCRVRDLQSRNGTFVNGERVDDGLLRDGDEIAAGHTTFVVRVHEVASAADSARGSASASGTSSAFEGTSPTDLSRPSWPAPERASGGSNSDPVQAREPVATVVAHPLQKVSSPMGSSAPSAARPTARAHAPSQAPRQVQRPPARDAVDPPVMRKILEEHFTELDFLWQQRERNIFASDWTIRNLATHEERAEAHLDGLRIGGEHAVAIARPFLAGEQVGTATAAGFVFLAMESPALAAELMDALSLANDAVRTGIRIALRHGDVGLVTDALYALAFDQDAKLRVLAADVLAFHRLRPPPDMGRLLEHDEPGVRRIAYGAAGRVQNVLTIRHVEDAMRSEDPLLRRIALEAAAWAGMSDVVAICRKAARGTAAVPEAVAFLGVVGAHEDLATIRAAMHEPALLHAAIDALGALGDAAGVPLLLEAMANPEIANHAAAAFTRITGIADLRSALPTHEPTGDAGAGGPAVDQARAAAAWERLKGSLKGDGRWQRGENTAAMSLAASMAALPLRVRRDVYLGARAARAAAVPDVEVEGRAMSRPT